MQALALPLLAMASINLYVGLYHLLLFLRRRHEKPLLPFALLCFCVFLYDAFTIGLYDSTSVAAGVFWQALQLRTGDAVSILIIWFATLYVGKASSRLLIAFTLWFAILFLLSFVASPGLTLSPSEPAIKTVRLPWGPEIVYYEGRLGIVYLVQVVSAALAYAYVIGLLYRYRKSSGNRDATIIIVGQAAYFIGVINDSLVAAGVYPFIYLSEYAFLLIILAMSFVLFRRFVGLYEEIEESNKSLEAKVRARTEEITMLNEEFKHLAEMDGLTGIYNRRFFNNYLEMEVKRARNRLELKDSGMGRDSDMNFGLAMIDIDHFKLINDTYGHPEGDRALVELVEVIKNNIFSRDLFCRYGGEEFVILFTRTSREGILLAAEKIRRGVEMHPFYFGAEKEPRSITISVGTVIFGDTAPGKAEEILKIADDRLLKAKQAGRNRTIFT